jgi:hypothetical protein
MTREEKRKSMIGILDALSVPIEDFRKLACVLIALPPQREAKGKAIDTLGSRR